MTKQDFLEFKGEVKELLPNAMFRVKLENDHEFLAHTAGKLKKNRIRDIDYDYDSDTIIMLSENIPSILTLKKITN